MDGRVQPALAGVPTRAPARRSVADVCDPRCIVRHAVADRLRPGRRMRRGITPLRTPRCASPAALCAGDKPDRSGAARHCGLRRGGEAGCTAPPCIICASFTCAGTRVPSVVCRAGSEGPGYRPMTLRDNW